MKKLLCILTVATMLFSLSAGTVAALSPESTACINSSDSNLNTNSFKSVCDYVLNLDLEALFDRFLQLFSGAETEAASQTETAAVNLPASDQSCDSALPAASSGAAATDGSSDTAAAVTQADPVSPTKTVKTSAEAQTTESATETAQTSCGSKSNACTSSGSCEQAACPNTDTQCGTSDCTQNNVCSGDSNCTQYGFGQNFADICSGLLGKYGVNIDKSDSNFGNNTSCDTNDNSCSAGNSTTESKSPASTASENTVETGTETPANGESTETPASDTSIDNLSFEQQVVALVNEQRAANGLAALTLNESLSDVARAKSQDMHDNNYFSHTSPTYGSPFDMLKTFGISYRSAGENIAMGYQTPQAVMDGWMNSSGHRANILNSSYTQIGVGYVADGNYWTQEFIG